MQEHQERTKTNCTTVSFLKRLPKTSLEWTLMFCLQYQLLKNFHSIHVYYQVQIWFGNVYLKHIKCLWQVVNGIVIPEMINALPVTESLLNLIWYNCKMCCNALSTCMKHYLNHLVACEKCHATACTNLCLKMTE